MKALSDENLLESYFDAIDMRLENEFIDLLYQEIKRRNLVSVLNYEPNQMHVKSIKR